MGLVRLSNRPQYFDLKRDFGAVGDGIHDDCPNLQNAINYINTIGGGVLYIPFATYLMASLSDPSGKHVIQLYDTVSIISDGATLKLANNFGDYHSFLHGAGGLNNVTYKGFTLNDNTTNNPMTNQPSSDNNYRAAIFLGTGTSTNVTIDSVTINDCCGVWQISTNAISGLNIKNCIINYTTIVPGITYDRTSVYFGGNNGSFINNRLNGSAAANTGIEVHGQNNVITNNKINNYNGAIFIVADQQYNTEYRNVTVSNNDLTNVVTGVDVWPVNSIPMSNIKITNNNIYISPDRIGTASTLEGNGITFYPTWAVTAIDDVDISGNTIKFKAITGKAIDTTTSYCGIFIPCYTASYSYVFNNLKIKGNQIDSPLQHGIMMDTQNATGLSSQFNGLDISDNTIRNPGQVASANGIYINTFAAGVGCRITENTVIDDRATCNTNYPIAVLGNTTGDETTAVKIYDNTIDIHDSAWRSKATPASYFDLSVYHILRQTLSVNGQLPFSSVAGSQVVDRVSGRIFTQTTTPSGSTWNSVTYASALPGSGYFTKGDQVINTAPAQGGNAGWTCTQSGTRTNTGWTSGTTYTVGQIVNAGGNIYQCTTAGASTSTVQPTGTGNTGTLADGYAWTYLSVIALMSPYGTINTVKSGTGTINASSTTATVTHSLGYTPSVILLTPQGNVGNVWVSPNITSSQFTINCSAAPASNTTVAWEVRA